MVSIGCRKVILACALLAVLTCSARPLLAQTAAQSWPQRPVKFIVTLGAGSGVDIGMRLLADSCLSCGMSLWSSRTVPAETLWSR